MKSYASRGFDEFVICLGYKGDYIKEYFLNYRARQGSLTVDLRSGSIQPHTAEASENWLVHLLETGNDSMTGGRVKRAAQFLRGRRFMLTYGDGLADIDASEVLAFHERTGKLATITAVRPPSRFGGLVIEGDLIRRFEEKPAAGENWINGGYMVFEPGVDAYIEDDATILERAPLETLAREGQLAVYQHPGYWQCMDTLRDKEVLEELWRRDQAPWKQW
jgi:glucose-1-phosphate cytidylyltransferase